MQPSEGGGAEGCFGAWLPGMLFQVSRFSKFGGYLIEVVMLRVAPRFFRKPPSNESRYSGIIDRQPEDFVLSPFFTRWYVRMVPLYVILVDFCLLQRVRR